MARIVAALMRHGQFEKEEGVPSARLPHPLTVAGEAEARDGADQIVDLSRKHGLSLRDPIHTSSLLRAWQTADLAAGVLSDRLGRPFSIQQTAALAERSLGPMANLTAEAIERIVARDPRFSPLPSGWKRDSDFRLPYDGTESLLQAGRRVARYMDETLARCASEAIRDTLVLFVGHGGAFRHAALTFDVLSRHEVAHLSMYYCRAVLLERLDNGTYVHIDGDWKPRRAGASSVD